MSTRSFTRTAQSALLVFVISLTGGALAQEREEGPAPGTTLVLTETASREVEQDTVVASLVARAEGADPATVQGEVNRMMTDALEVAQQLVGTSPATGGYRVYQRYDRDGQPTTWIAEQELRLEGGEVAEVLEHVGTLQEQGLAVQGLGFELSRQVRLAVEDELTLEAIARVQDRAEAIAEALDAAVGRVARLVVGGSQGISPRPMFEARAMAADASAPPSAVPDLETVTVSIDAEIALAPR